MNTELVHKEFTSHREDGSISIVHDKDNKMAYIIIAEDGNAIKVGCNMDLFESVEDYDRVKGVRDAIYKANMLGRASQALKNHLKRNLWPRLYELGEISEEEYKKEMGNLLKEDK